MNIDYDTLTTEQLRRELRSRGLRVSGTKAVLLERLQQYEREGGGRRMITFGRPPNVEPPVVPPGVTLKVPAPVPQATPQLIVPRPSPYKPEQLEACPPDEEGNIIDEITQETIPHERLITVKEGNKVFCFDLDTLAKNLQANPQTGQLNPYTRKQFSPEILSKVQAYMEKDLPLDEQLRRAVETKNLMRTRDLLDRGANPNIKSPDGFPLLTVAVKSGDLNVVRLLLEYKADPNMKDSNFGFTPMMSAVTRGYVDIVKLLVEYNADVNARDNSGGSVLEWAISTYINMGGGGGFRQRQFEIIEYLIGKGARTIDENIRRQMTYGYQELNRLLINAGLMPPEVIPTPGFTPVIESPTALLDRLITNPNLIETPDMTERVYNAMVNMTIDEISAYFNVNLIPIRFQRYASKRYIAEEFINHLREQVDNATTLAGPPMTPVRARAPVATPAPAPGPLPFRCSDYTVNSLKDELRRRGARLSGSKQTLCERLEAILREEGRQ